MQNNIKAHNFGLPNGQSFTKSESFSQGPKTIRGGGKSSLMLTHSPDNSLKSPPPSKSNGGILSSGVKMLKNLIGGGY